MKLRIGLKANFWILFLIIVCSFPHKTFAEPPKFFGNSIVTGCTTFVRRALGLEDVGDKIFATRLKVEKFKNLRTDLEMFAEAEQMYARVFSQDQARFMVQAIKARYENLGLKGQDLAKLVLVNSELPHIKWMRDGLREYKKVLLSKKARGELEPFQNIEAFTDFIEKTELSLSQVIDRDILTYEEFISLSSKYAIAASEPQRFLSVLIAEDERMVQVMLENFPNEVFWPIRGHLSTMAFNNTFGLNFFHMGLISPGTLTSVDGKLRNCIDLFTHDKGHRDRTHKLIRLGKDYIYPTSSSQSPLEDLRTFLSGREKWINIDLAFNDYSKMFPNREALIMRVVKFTFEHELGMGPLENFAYSQPDAFAKGIHAKIHKPHSLGEFFRNPENVTLADVQLAVRRTLEFIRRLQIVIRAA